MGKKGFAPSQVRTVALVGHRSCGKTSLGDAWLYASGVTRTRGSVDLGTSLLDHGVEERRRRMTLGLSSAWLQWRDHLVQVLDAPGSDDLAHERSLAMHGADAVVLVVDGTAGVEVGTKAVIDDAAELDLPFIAVITKMDRRGSAPTLAGLDRCASGRVVPLQVPHFDDEGQFCGVVCLIRGKMLRYDPSGSGTFSPEPIPTDAEPMASRAYESLVEAVALTDDELLEEYLEYLELPLDKVMPALAVAVQRSQIVPVCYVSATGCVAAGAVLDVVIDLLPSPVQRPWPLVSTDGPPPEFTAQHLASRLDGEGELYHILRVWSGMPRVSTRWILSGHDSAGRVRKTYALRGPRRAAPRYAGRGAVLATWDPLPGRPGDTYTSETCGAALRSPTPLAPMVTWLLRPKDARTADRLPGALEILLQIDGAIEVSDDELTGYAVIRGHGDTHLMRAVRVLRSRLGMNLDTELPPVPYRETPAGSIRDVLGVHRRYANGEVAEFGTCTIEVYPVASTSDCAFEDALPPDALPERFVGGLERGAVDAARHGPTAGYPVVGLGVRWTHGDYDVLQSEEEHFRIAGSKAVRAALAMVGTQLLEPWSKVQVRCPADEVGPTLADITHHGGRIIGLDVQGVWANIQAECPQRVLLTFARRLKRLTGGLGRFSSNYECYRPLPEGLCRDAITASPFLNPCQKPATGLPKPTIRRVGRVDGG